MQQIGATIVQAAVVRLPSCPLPCLAVLGCRSRSTRGLAAGACRDEARAALPSLASPRNGLVSGLQLQQQQQPSCVFVSSAVLVLSGWRPDQWLHVSKAEEDGWILVRVINTYNTNKQ